ncbi:hypothetical protein PtrSN002B_006558 [Pyrenophora tritici-repentis]|uniref:Macoilin multi-domain protein n=1 Tax=Pyrenophora tritici-repentis TaxID=45151 RepID=A0A2W1F669_9PLEO|nr:hypothetical protein PtrV1_08678 [Pyrenophora tritici-repentis]KAF7449719.1 hypothetical protein A1F99_067680 [Pyrenophora tritici-repentis]KAF7570155.1 Macoilin multi-domain protein [Pyrenophora tritici-repentis]KAG9383349.1 hypothetical protein A1F94_005260 [Pyrenophora tritici-repentis]KAI0591307.1 hypothetical protein Alg130_01372 [Pyrenophora tritici-repentis]
MPQPVKQEEHEDSRNHLAMLPEAPRSTARQRKPQKIKQEPNAPPIKKITKKLNRQIAHVRHQLAVEKTRHSTLTEYTTKAVQDASAASTKAAEHTKALTTRVDRLRHELSQAHHELSVVKRDYKMLQQVAEGLKRDLRAEKRSAEENEMREERVEGVMLELEEERQRCEILEKRLREERAKRREDRLALEKVRDLVGTRIVKRE